MIATHHCSVRWVTSPPRRGRGGPRRRRAGCGRCRPAGRARSGRGARRQVPFELTVTSSPAAIFRLRASARRQLDLALAPLELELRACGRRRGPRRAAGRRRGAGPCRGRGGLSAGFAISPVAAHGRGQRGVLADVAERDAAVAALGDLLEGDGGVRRELDAEALGELRDPGELVGARRDDGAALALQAALEVERRAVALEVARARKDEVGEAGGTTPRTSRSRSRASACSASARTPGSSGRLVARDDDEHRLDVLDSPSSAQLQASATPRPFGVRGR